MDARSTLTLRTGAKMPVLGLGTWELTDHTAETVLHALRSGYRMIDTACDYGSQAGIGEALARHGRREDVYLVAKVEEDDDAYGALKSYLREMRTPYADLVLIHRPPDEEVGAELWKGLARARQERLARDIGVSNYTVEQLRRLRDAVGETPVVNQIEWSPFGHSVAMLDFCRERRIVIQAYSPLTRGERLGDARLRNIAGRYGRTQAQVLIRWNLQLGTAPLPKANRREHLDENIDVFDFVITDADVSALNHLNERYSALGSLAYA